MLAFKQVQTLSQKLTPQQIQYQKLLQMNSFLLEQRIKEEMEQNPLLEESYEQRLEDPDERIEIPEDSREPSSETTAIEVPAPSETASAADEIEPDFGSDDDKFEDLKDYMQEDDYYDDPAAGMNRNEDEERGQPFGAIKETMTEKLLDQLYLLDISEEMRVLGEEIVGNIDSDGYLTQDLNSIVQDLSMFQHITISIADAEKLLKKIQKFEPPGIAARSLQECLVNQLKYYSFDPYFTYLAEKMLLNHFDDFMHKRFDHLRQVMSLSQDTLRSVLELIHRLNPKPGAGTIESEEANQITPDFLIERIGEEYTITLNDRAQPVLVVNPSYQKILDTKKGKKSLPEQEKQTYKFLREKFDSAQWFIKCIEQRRDTLLKVMRSILMRQLPFFESGPKYLKPMIYKDVADEISMDISTISRVVNGKYVQSAQGIHELKYFFSEGIVNDEGEEIANKRIKEFIKEMIGVEDKKVPLSDDKIADMLKEQGIPVARRTVAKYREQMKIPVARLRKEL